MLVVCTNKQECNLVPSLKMRTLLANTPNGPEARQVKSTLERAVRMPSAAPRHPVFTQRFRIHDAMRVLVLFPLTHGKPNLNNEATDTTCLLVLFFHLLLSYHLCKAGFILSVMQFCRF